MVITGLSEYFGSCITMAMRLPRISRHCCALRPSRLWPWNASLLAVTLPGVRPRMARPVCDLPDPDSPTIASFSRPMAKLTSRTACTSPTGVLNLMFSLSISRIGSPAMSAVPGIKHVAQAVADQVEAEADDEDGD